MSNFFAPGCCGPVDPYGGMVRVGSCNCLIPQRLNMVCTPNNVDFGQFQSCTLTYGPADPCYASLSYTGPAHFSNVLNDPIAHSDFRYILECISNSYFIRRLYCTSPYGSPFADGIICRWQMGGIGNQCTPFFLHNGTPYPGSDPVTVTIDPA